MKKMVTVIMVAISLAGFCYETCTTNGYTFSYVVSDGKATYTGDTKDYSYSGDLVIPSVINGIPVVCIGDNSFNMIPGLKEVVIENGIQEIAHAAFYADGTGPTCVTIPQSVVRITGSYVFRTMPRIKWTVSGAPLSISSGAFCIFRSGSIHVTALAGVPSGMPKVGVTGYLDQNPCFCCKREYAGEWLRYYNNDVSRVNSISSSGFGNVIQSSMIRENDPTIMDVVYKVSSQKPTVKVRVLAFVDGERSFSKVLRPETFVDGTDASIGDNIVPNVEHTVSWRVSADYTNRLAKIKFEVLACEGDILPLEMMTIPESDQYGKMKISWNALWDEQAFDALMWLYADKTSDLTCAGGRLMNEETLLANGTTISAVNAMTYIYGKMGYSLLTGDPLTYANSETRLGLSPSGARQYAYKIVEE